LRNLASCSPFTGLRGSRRKPDFFADCRPVDALHDQFKIEGELHLANDEYRWVAVFHTDQVTAIDLAFDGIARAFHEGL
jgi:hypothetical protein